MTKDEKETVEEIIDKPEINKDIAPKEETKTSVKKPLSPNTKILIATISISLLLAGLTIGVVYAMISSNESEYYQPDGMAMNYQSQPRMHRVYVQTSTVTSETTKTVVSGVVKSIDGDSFVIAGNGEHKTIKTTVDTVFNTTNKTVAVDDSVVVVGTLSDDIITATNIQIANN